MSVTQTQAAEKAPNKPVTGKWIHLTDANPHTYASSNIRSFLWTQDSEFEYGKLMVRFQTSGTYVYDLPKHIFDSMAKRAFKPEDYHMSTGEWYSNRFFGEAKKIHHTEPLYVDKIEV